MRDILFTFFSKNVDGSWAAFCCLVTSCKVAMKSGNPFFASIRLFDQHLECIRCLHYSLQKELVPPVSLRYETDLSRLDWSVQGLESDAGSGSEPPVQAIMKRSVALRQPGRGSPMTAVPRTDAIRVSADRRTQQPLRGSQREHAWQHPPSAAAAVPSLTFQGWATAISLGTSSCATLRPPSNTFGGSCPRWPVPGALTSSRCG